MSPFCAETPFLSAKAIVTRPKGAIWFVEYEHSGAAALFTNWPLRNDCPAI